MTDRRIVFWVVAVDLSGRPSEPYPAYEGSPLAGANRGMFARLPIGAEFTYSGITYRKVPAPP